MLCDPTPLRMILDFLSPNPLHMLKAVVNWALYSKEDFDNFGDGASFYNGITLNHAHTYLIYSGVYTIEIEITSIDFGQTTLYNKGIPANGLPNNTLADWMDWDGAH